jgi:hypothetical protein
LLIRKKLVPNKGAEEIVSIVYKNKESPAQEPRPTGELFAVLQEDPKALEKLASA